MTFVDSDTVVVADWRASQLHAVHLGPAAQVVAAAFDVVDVSSCIALALNAHEEDLQFEDLAFRPGAERAYITITVQPGSERERAALVSVDPHGAVDIVDMARTSRETFTIRGRPNAEKSLWRDVPETMLTITNVLSYGGRLYVAGLSNDTFASTVQVCPYPFDRSEAPAVVELGPPLQGEFETRVPIRGMAVVEGGGVPTVIVAYACDLLVTIPLAELRSGARVQGVTLADLGGASPLEDIVALDGDHGPVVIVARSNAPLDLVSIGSDARASLRPSLTRPVESSAVASPLRMPSCVRTEHLVRLADQDGDFVGALCRNPRGALDLVSIEKDSLLRPHAARHRGEVARDRARSNESSWWLSVDDAEACRQHPSW